MDLQLKMHDIENTSWNYIARHIKRIETEFKHNRQAQLDSLWRIASNAELFETLDDSLTEEQEDLTWQFVKTFKHSHKGALALENIQRDELS